VSNSVPNTSNPQHLDDNSLVVSIGGVGERHYLDRTQVCQLSKWFANEVHTNSETFQYEKGRVVTFLTINDVESDLFEHVLYFFSSLDYPKDADGADSEETIDAWSCLLQHTRVYYLAVRWSISGLKVKAAEAFEKEGNEGPFCLDLYISSLEYMYCQKELDVEDCQNPLPSGRTLKEYAIQRLVKHARIFLANRDFKELCERNGALALAILERISKSESLNEDSSGKLMKVFLESEKSEGFRDFCKSNGQLGFDLAQMFAWDVPEVLSSIKSIRLTGYIDKDGKAHHINEDDSDDEVAKKVKSMGTIVFRPKAAATTKSRER